jgi:hypothetical protein
MLTWPSLSYQEVGVGVVYDTSLGTTIRAAREDSLMEGLRFSMFM